MSQARKSRSVQATSDGQQKLKQAKATKHSEKNKPWTFPDIATAAGLDEKTVKTFFSGKPVDKGSALAIAQALNLQLTDIVDANELEAPIAHSEPEQKLLIHRQVCQGMLVEKRRLTTNPLTTGDGTTFERGDVYVPLGLVERKRQAKRTGDDSPEQGSKLYEPTEYEVTRRFEHDEFFEQVLKLGISPKSKGKRIAIIGEPGAGKTTLLQQIADWVFEDTDQDVAIWVSLADLQGRTLEEYLLSVWLKDALKRARVTPEMEDSLVELFNRGRVWLLLDGVDEMAMGASGNAPLQAIAKQLTTSWVSSARVVLTCRLNVWDVGKNALERFDTYRTLEFSYGNSKKPDSDQVNQFISKWFEPTDPQLGKALRTALDQRGKERIKDLVKNPLRLALMCYSWQRRQGELPKTKATLYQRFVEVFYEWKQEYFPTTSATRQKLNQALGKLAVEAIAQSSSRFRLTRCFVREVLGEPDAPMFQLAIQLGWLNQVGVATEDPDEPVYAFYHPTFQEYFAALAIDDWHCFLNHVPDNPDSGIYRIFEPQWKEVILLWLGREDVSKQEKEEFIKALVNFDDRCRNFYWYRAYFLAAIAIAEFQDCSLGDEIVGRLTHWILQSNININQDAQCFILQPKTRDWEREVHDEIAKVALEVLKETEREKAIAAFVQLINTANHSSTRSQVALNLWQIDPGNETAIVELIKSVADEESDFSQPATKVLEQISTLSENAITAIVELIQATLQLADREWIYGANLSTVRQAAHLLGKFDPGNEAAIAALVEKIQTEDDEWRRTAAECLGIVDPGNEIAIATLVKEIQMPEDEACRRQALLSLSMNNITRWHIAVGTNLDILNSYSNNKRHLLAADSLRVIGRRNDKAIVALKQLVQATQDEYRRSQTLLRNCSEE
ncbi:MAG: NACHT domain-containing protein, partial [Microcoleus sp. SIO2G3]|nr:NACHT domain-containing protein [Microcoleus sp. SIO2G3]